MKDDSPFSWSRLEADRPTGDRFTGRLASPSLTKRLLIALDAAGRRHFLVVLTEADKELRDRSTRGVRVETEELTVSNDMPRRYIDVVCQDPAGHGAFDLIGADLATGLATNALQPSVLVTGALAKWRRFWGNVPRSALSREEQLGLFAELWFLSVWLLPKVGADESIRRWRGPFGARHDFEWIGRSVEVKASTSTRAPIHRINGLDQLSPPEKGDLLFFSVRLREEQGAANTLPLLVRKCRDQVSASAEALDGFETSLAGLGYVEAHDDQYDARYRVVSEALYKVTDAFPKITPMQIAGGIPPGVETVLYDINLSACEPLVIARNPADLPTL